MITDLKITVKFYWKCTSIVVNYSAVPLHCDKLFISSSQGFVKTACRD